MTLESTLPATRAEPPAPDAGLVEAWRTYLLALADDEMLLGHRDSEWTGLGPILEEDIAFSSMAQDELGHALLWYQLLERWGGPAPNDAAFLRDAADWRNARLVELPRGDYATSLMRRYLADLAEAVRYDALVAGAPAEVAEVARKLRQEEKYHLLHGRSLVQRLGRASSESRDRLQAALDELLPYALGLWESPDGEEALVAAGQVPASAELEAAWLNALVPTLRSCNLEPAVEEAPLGGWRPRVEPVLGGRRGRHGPELDELLEAMQGLYRSDPEVAW
jgi:ring-1,2-phenylacetyl-CoA epoxidase subunit PaaC